VDVNVDGQMERNTGGWREKRGKISKKGEKEGAREREKGRGGRR